MPYLRVWRYRVAPGEAAAFAAAYGPAGAWATLFRRAEGYLGTDLLHGKDVAITIDRWRNETDWERFLAAHRAEYETLDRELAGLCVEDAEVASFASPESPA
jgi:heme-degrading monooxygenase HmoA